MLTLFWNADWVVKSVILLLLGASIWSWAIIFEKVVSLRRLNGRADTFENAFWSGGAIDELYDRIGSRPQDPMSALFVAAMREWRRVAGRGGNGDRGLGEGVQDRIERVMQVTANRELDRIERYMTFLASTGSTAPFIGLFGTVWGIMNSFEAIGATKNTSLAVVAPGIAEALFATALGLLAAIPAVLAYNKLSRDLDRYSGRLNGFAGEFLAILSRQIDERT
jgi:biopolymer transport protein TolQ